MSIQGAGLTGPQIAHNYSVKVERLAQDQMRREGEQAVQLIEQARNVPRTSPDGLGQLIDTYA